MVENLSLLIVGILLFFPALIQIRYYYLIRSPNYLWFSTLLFSFAVNIGVIGLLPQTILRQIIVILSITSIFFSITLLLYKTPTRFFALGNEFLLIYILLYAINFILLLLLLKDPPTKELVNFFRILAEEVLQIIIGRRMFLTYKHLDLTLHNHRTARIRKIWMIFGLALISMALIRAPIYLLLSASYVVSPDLFISIAGIEQIAFLIVNLGTVPLGLSIVGLSIFYPESLLLTDEQILKASRLHNMVEKYADRRPSLINEAYLLDYLNEIKDFSHENKKP